MNANGVEIKLLNKKYKIMNCPKCKNPIEDNVAVCEWCGANCVSQIDNLSTQEKETNGLDDELIALLSKHSFPNGKLLNIHPAKNLYQETTGKSNGESIYYVSRLNFFRTHKYADESAWQKEWEKQKKRGKILVWVFIICFLIPIAILIFYELN
jgi:hypothetical protein